ncbi:MAG: restriction endonuclease [Infirmifilum sp.]|uniref:restriction endonuclease n=1 Tax=Infirmifilum TaxID=2856573 RepID=UPI0023557756
MGSVLRAEIVLTSTVRLLSQQKTVSVSNIAQASGVDQLFVEDFLKSIGVLVEQGIVKTPLNSLLLRAWLAGYDVVTLALNSGWSTFEEVVAQALREAGFNAYRALRFKHQGKRYEVDILAVKSRLALCVDCKRWERLRESMLLKAAEAQRHRCEALARVIERGLPQVDIPVGDYEMIPVVVSLYRSSIPLYFGALIIDLRSLSQIASEDVIVFLRTGEIQPIRFQVSPGTRLF